MNTKAEKNAKSDTPEQEEAQNEEKMIEKAES